MKIKNLKLKILFFGTPDYVIPILEALYGANYEIVAVVTQPDKPVGRKQILAPSPVKQWAQSHEIRVLAPEKSDEEFVSNIKHLASNIDIGILAAYGNIIPQEVLDLSPVGMLNLHPSLLPKYRGTSPVQAAIVAGDRQTGATIIRMDEKHDHGPILAQFTEDIKPDDTTGSLRARLFEKGAEVLAEMLPAYLEGRVELREQDHSKAIFVRLVKKEHAFIPPHYLASALQGVPLQEEWEIPFIKDFTTHPSPATIHNFIRALDPWPLAWTEIKLKIDNQEVTRRLKIIKAHVEENPIAQEPNNLIPYLVLDEVQLEGKSPVSWKQFKNGYPEATFAS
ncbi:methionyl-tRNA formyltransferase [Candidatus Microgenomates bacterium]|nr:methionyl-tRNA formyltransferase [Candidatus Microgenomates bacterium]